VDKAALGQVFFEHYGFPCQSFHRLLHIHHHLSSGVGTIGQIVAYVQSGFSLTPSQETIKVKGMTSNFPTFMILTLNSSSRIPIRRIAATMHNLRSNTPHEQQNRIHCFQYGARCCRGAEHFEYGLLGCNTVYFIDRCQHFAMKKEPLNITYLKNYNHIQGTVIFTAPKLKFCISVNEVYQLQQFYPMTSFTQR
jgi:hypothetical protein